MKILITGVTGQLGHDVAREAERRGHEVIGVGRADDADCRTYIKCDITSQSEICGVIEATMPQVVIHCAAYTNVDAAEENIELCDTVNIAATNYIADVCAHLNIKMIYISTDYVFDDYDDEFREMEREVPIRPRFEYEKPRSCQVYGHSKRMGERNVQHYFKFAKNPNWLIIRISWVFGANGKKNFVKTMLNLAKTNTEVSVICDQIGRPTYTKDAARLLIDMACGTVWGEIFHVQNEGEYISWFDLTRKIYALSGKTQITVKPIMTEEYEKAMAKRPKNSMLSTKKLREFGFQPLPKWEDALKRFLIEIGEIDEV